MLSGCANNYTNTTLKNQTYDAETAFNKVLDMVKEFGCNNESESIKNIIHGCLSMEETDFCVNAIKEEAEEMMAVDAFCCLDSK